MILPLVTLNLRKLTLRSVHTTTGETYFEISIDNVRVDCAMKKSPRNRHHAPLFPIPVENAFDRVAVDCLEPFPCSNAGNRYVVVFTEYLTRWPEAFAVPNIDARTIANLLVEKQTACAVRVMHSFCMSITDYPRASVSSTRDRRLGEQD